MKNLLFILLLTSCFAGKEKTSSGFEGKVTYSISYSSHLPTVPDSLLTLYMGTKQDYYIKEGNYKSILYGAALEWQLYFNGENKIYSKLSKLPKIKEDDASVNNDEILKTEIRRNAVDILGYKCDELKLTCISGIQMYYFNNKFPIEPSLYRKHKYGNWADYVDIAKAIPLKMVIQTEAFTVESVATEIKEQKIESSFFELPTGS